MDVKKPNMQTSSRSANSGISKSKSGGPKALKVFAVTVGVLVLVGAAAFGAMWLGKATTGSSSVNTEIQTDKFQAVFLTNGQVYFGKLSNAEGNYIKLKNIYYLQVQQSVQPSTANPEESAAQDGSQVSLTKLGQELHGPTDQMYISRSEVLFWENLKEDSTVVKAISDYEKK